MCDVSILIPVYNGAATIKRCIDSLLKQSYKDFYILVGNDESTDSTIDILKEYDCLKIFTCKKSTVGDVRNFLIKKCRTKYFMFVDADDTLESNAIEIMYNEMSSSSCDIVMGLTEKCLDKKMILNDSNKYDYLFNNRVPYFVTCWNKLYKTSLFYDVAFPSYSLGEDEFVIHHILKNAHTILILPFVTYNYYNNLSGLSKKINEHYLEAIYALLDRYKFFLDTEYEKKMYIRFTNYLIEIFVILKSSHLSTSAVLSNYKKVFSFRHSSFKYIIFRFIPSFFYYLQLVRRRFQ